MSIPAPVITAGERYGRLTVVAYAGMHHAKLRQRAYLCRCDCGAEKVVASSKLRTGRTRSCGCLKRDGMVARNTTHGLRHHPLYATWATIVQRCTNPNNEKWAEYGGRGIIICARWRRSFAAFLADMGERPEWATGGIDRRDNDGNYEPSNCRWATLEQQRANRRDT